MDGLADASSDFVQGDTSAGQSFSQVMGPPQTFLLSDFSSVEKLDGGNYREWSRTMMDILMLKGLWVYVEMKPHNLEELVVNFAWRQQNQLAAILLKQTLNSSMRELVDGISNAWEIWSKLKSLNKESALTLAMQRWKTLSSTRMADTDRVAAHIAKMESTFAQVKAVGQELIPIWKVTLLLSSLPPRFDTMVTIFETWEADLLTWESVTNKLLRYDQKREVIVEETVMLNRDRKWKETRTCYICAEKGHLARNCPKKLKRGEKVRRSGSAVKNQEKLMEKQSTSYREKDKAKVAGVMTTEYTSDESCCSFMMASCEKDLKRSSGWWVDSGATSHVCYQEELFSDIKPASNHHVRSASGLLSPVGGVGSVSIFFSADESKLMKWQLHGVLYVADYIKNLLSVKKLLEAGIDVHFWNSNQTCTLERNGKVLCRGVVQGNLFKLLECDPEEQVNLTENRSLLNLWHCRLGHLSEHSIRALQGMSCGVEIEKSQKLEFCEACVQGKAHKSPAPRRSLNRSERLLDLIHSDVCGPMPVKSLGGARYFVSFVDDKSRKSFVYLISSKAQVLEKFVIFVNMTERQVERRVKRLRSDGGGEYASKDFQAYLSAKGILKDVTARDSPHQNGVAERLNRTLQEKALSMLQHAKLGQEFWGAAIMTANYLRNISPTAALKNVTPEECWSENAGQTCKLFEQTQSADMLTWRCSDKLSCSSKSTKGRHIQSVLSEMGVETISDLKTVSLKQISGRLGDRIGLFLFNSSRGEDPSPVQDKGPPKSLSVEDSFRNCQTLKQAEGILRMLAPDLIKRLDEDREETRRRPKTFTLKWRVHGTNWNFISVSTEMPFELLSASLAIEKRASAAVDLAVKLLSRSAGQTFHLVVLNIGATNFVSDSTASSPGVCDIRSFLQGQGKSLGKEMKFVSKSEARVRRESFRAMATEVPSPTSQHLMSRATRLLELNHGPGALREKLSDSHGFCDELLMDSDSSGSDEEEDLAHQLSSTIRPYCSSAGVGKNSMSHDGVSHTSNHEHVQLLRTKSPGKNTSLSSNFAMGSVLFDPPSVVGTNQFAEVGQIVREARPDHEPLCSSRELEYFENVPNVPQECLRHMPAISANLLAHEMGGTNATSNWSTNGDQGRVQASPTIPCHRSEPAERTTDSAAHDNMDGKPSCSSPCEIRNLGGDGIRIHGGDPDSINPGWFFCEDCGKSVEESESGKQEHADFHYAMALDKEEAGLSRVHSNKRDKPSNPSKKRKSRNGTLDGFVVRH